MIKKQDFDEQYHTKRFKFWVYISKCRLFAFFCLNLTIWTVFHNSDFFTELWVYRNKVWIIRNYLEIKSCNSLFNYYIFLNRIEIELFASVSHIVMTFLRQKTKSALGKVDTYLSLMVASDQWQDWSFVSDGVFILCMQLVNDCRLSQSLYI